MTAPAVASRPRLAPQQRAIFNALAEREGAAVPYTDLNHAIGLPIYADTLHLRVLVCHLRKRIAATGSEIQAIKGEGYRLYRTPGAVFPWEGA